MSSGTVAVLADRWLSSYVPTARCAKAARIAARRVELYLKPYLGMKPAARVAGGDLRAYRLWLEERKSRGRPLSPQTVAHVLADARCMFRWAASEGLVDRSPVPGRLLPRIQERRPDRLTDEEVDRLLAIPDPWAYAIRLGLATGLRWGELARAQASDVEKSGMLVVSQTKTGKLRRVPIPAELVRDRVGLLVPFGDPIAFAKKVRRLSGVTRFHPHQLRHTFACRWLEERRQTNGALAALQQILGHSTIVTTQRYARLTDAIVQAEAELGRNGEENGEVGSARSA